MREIAPASVDQIQLRRQVSSKYTEVALEPEKGFHFHTGRPLAVMLGYDDADIDRLPKGTVDSFAGTGNPFSMGDLAKGEVVLDIGCGAGFDTLIAARRVGQAGKVIAVDMTQAMLDKMLAGVAELGLRNVDGRLGYAEQLPLESESVDVVISNGVINLCPDKMAVMAEVYRVLRPGGRFQIGDIVVHRAVPQEAGRAELPALCWEQSGSKCSIRRASSTFAGAARSTSSRARSTNPMPRNSIPGV